MGIKYGGRATRWGVSRPMNTSRSTQNRNLPLPELRFSNLMGELEPPLQDVVRRAFFDDPERFVKFASARASAHGHHSVRGGNLLHTIDVAECALLLAKHYEELVDKQVVLAAALLHDIGKSEEYEDTPRGAALSEAGEMGHKLVGFGMAWAALEPLRKTNSGRAHAILNAIGCASRQSYDLRRPATLEAMIVSKADQLSAAADLFRESMRNAGNRFAGVKHPHLPERPRHPRALITDIAASSLAQATALTRVQRYPRLDEGGQ